MADLPKPLREGEVMGAYMDFDRTADKAWTSAEYLVRFGQFVSQRTADQLRAYAAAPDLSGLVWALHAGGLGTEQSRKVHMFFDTEEQARAFVEWCQLKIGKLGPNSEVLQPKAPT